MLRGGQVALHHFLQDCIHHPLLRDSHYLGLFLTLDTEEWHEFRTQGLKKSRQESNKDSNRPSPFQPILPALHPVLEEADEEADSTPSMFTIFLERAKNAFSSSASPASPSSSDKEQKQKDKHKKKKQKEQSSKKPMMTSTAAATKGKKDTKSGKKDTTASEDPGSVLLHSVPEDRRCSELETYFEGLRKELLQTREHFLNLVKQQRGFGIHWQNFGDACNRLSSREQSLALVNLEQIRPEQGAQSWTQLNLCAGRMQYFLETGVQENDRRLIAETGDWSTGETNAQGSPKAVHHASIARDVRQQEEFFPSRSRSHQKKRRIPSPDQTTTMEVDEEDEKATSTTASSSSSSSSAAAAAPTLEGPLMSDPEKHLLGPLPAFLLLFSRYCKEALALLRRRKQLRQTVLTRVSIAEQRMERHRNWVAQDSSKIGLQEREERLKSGKQMLEREERIAERCRERLSVFTRLMFDDLRPFLLRKQRVLQWSTALFVKRQHRLQEAQFRTWDVFGQVPGLEISTNAEVKGGEEEEEEDEEGSEEGKHASNQDDEVSGERKTEEWKASPGGEGETQTTPEPKAAGEKEEEAKEEKDSSSSASGPAVSPMDG